MCINYQPKRTVILLLLLLSLYCTAFSQSTKSGISKSLVAEKLNFEKLSVYGNDSCHKSYELCSNGTFPAAVNGGYAAPGPFYGCLSTAPNPSWFHFKILQDAPSLTIRLESSRDIDYICWGPYSDSSNLCDSLTSNKVVNCSYSSEYTEELNMQNLQLGKFYVLLVTNYSNLPCDINISVADSIGVIGNQLPLAIYQENPQCNVLQLTASEGFESYKWNTGDTSRSIIITETGNYSVIGKLPGTCDAFDLFNVTELIPPINAGSISIMDSTYCHSTTLTAPDGYISYLWNTGDTTQTIQVSDGGTYSIIVISAENCLGYSEIEVADPLPPLPGGQITISDSTYCYTTTLTAPSGYETYRWNTGDTTQSIVVSHKGTYSFFSTNSEGCDVTSQIFVNAPNKPFGNQSICLVTYDETISKNKLVIEKILNVGIDSIFIYRADLFTNYIKIASLSINDPGIFTDTGSDPDHYAFKYRLNIKDTCGRVSTYCQNHTTILLTAELLPNNIVNLSWYPYEGIDYNKYHVYRTNNDGSEVLVNIVNTPQHSCTDLMPVNGLNRYQVKVLKNDFCYPDTNEFRSANSNIVEVNTLSINETLFESVSLNPNPARDFVVFNCNNNLIGSEYSVIDLSGRIIKAGKITDIEMKINLSSLKSGLYSFRVDGGGKPYFMKLFIRK